MDPDRGHLALSMPTSQSQQSSQSSQQQQQQQQQQQGQSQAQSSDINSEAQEGSPISVKRGPGRPKGSTKKLFEPDPSSVPKIKRPVGRPRKDGRPAGSVPKIPRAPGRPRKNFPAEYPDWVSFQGMFGNYRLPKDGSAVAGASDSNKAGSSNGVHTGANGASTSLSPTLPTAQIPDFVLATIYSLFSRSSTPANELPIPKDAIFTYKMHVSNLARTASRAYSILKTFWLPFSPLLFRLVSPRTAAPAKNLNANRNTNGLQPKPSASYLAYPQLNQANGDLHSTRASNVSEQAHDAHRFFYWDPYNLPLCGTLTCPQCQTPLKHNGPIRTGPLRVFDLPSGVSPTGTAHWQAGLVPAVFYVIGVHYSCQKDSCGAKFNSWDSKIVNNLPAMLADEWPVCTESVGSGPTSGASGSGSGSGGVNGGGASANGSAVGVNGEASSSGTMATTGSNLTTGSERTDSRGSKWNGDAISRPLFTLTRTLIQNGTSPQGLREVLGQLWHGDDEDKDDDVDEEEEEEEEIDENAEVEKEKVAEAEAIYSNPYDKIVSATQLPQSQTQDTDTSFEDTISDSRPSKRQRTNDLPSFLSPALPSTNINPSMTTTTTSHSGYISRPSTADVIGTSGMPLHVSPSQTQNQLQAAHEQQQQAQSRTNGSLHHHLNHRSSPRLGQGQQQQQQQTHSIHPPHSHSHSQSAATQHHPYQTTQTIQPQQSQNLHNATHSNSHSHSHPQAQTQTHLQNHNTHSHGQTAENSLLRRQQPHHQAQSQQQQQSHITPSHPQMHPPLRTLPSPRDVLAAPTTTTTTSSTAHNHAHSLSAHHGQLPPPTSTTHLHTPSPIYPPMSLPNSTANSPQTGSRLPLKRAFEELAPHSNGGAAGSMSSLTGGAGSTGTTGGGGSAAPASGPLPSPAQTHYHGLGHNSPFPTGRPLHQLTHPSHTQQHPGQQHQQHQHTPHAAHGHPSYQQQQQQHQQQPQQHQQQHQQHQSSVSSVAAAVGSTPGVSVGGRPSGLGSGQQGAHPLQILNLPHNVTLPRFPQMLNSNSSNVNAGSANATGLSMTSHHHHTSSSLLPPPHPHSVSHPSVQPPASLQSSSSLSSHHHHPGHPQQQQQQHSQSMQQGPTHIGLSSHHPHSHLRPPGNMQLPVPGPTPGHPQGVPQQTHHLSHSHSHHAQQQPTPQQQTTVSAGSHQGSTSHAPQRRVRHCVKCGQHECKGKGGAQFCKNPCKDCGEMNCRGRNSKRPNATCREGW